MLAARLGKTPVRAARQLQLRMPMFGSAQPESPFSPRGEATAEPDSTAGSPVKGGGNLEVPELDAALQLLAERAQYITGATGAAIALSEGEEMICRASAGTSGPSVGARLQVRSGLSGESISRKQLLRCDNAETDPRVNLDTCRQLGIASIVVLPLLARNGDVCGIFELFSDHAYAFEERDLIALERMGELTLTALDLAEKRPRKVSTPVGGSEPAATDPVVKNDVRLDPVQQMPMKAEPVPPGAAETLTSTVSGQAPSDTVDLPPAPPDRPLGTAQ